MAWPAARSWRGRQEQDPPLPTSPSPILGDVASFFSFRLQPHSRSDPLRHCRFEHGHAGAMATLLRYLVLRPPRENSPGQERHVLLKLMRRGDRSRAVCPVWRAVEVGGEWPDRTLRRTEAVARDSTPPLPAAPYFPCPIGSLQLNRVSLRRTRLPRVPRAPGYCA